jgi:signal peptidase II
MLHFPLWEGFLPKWMPFWGGKYFTFFDPVFNIADMSISTGFGILLVFSKKAFPRPENETRVSSSNPEEKES